MNGVLLELYRPKTWATLRMIEYCQMAQAIHHADDHRSHILSILGARGLAVPELDVWSYAESADLMHELPASSGG